MGQRKGAFIVIEGCDGAGTTTQAQRLQGRLQAAGHRAHVTCEPSKGWIGQQIRERLRGAPPDDEGYQLLALLFAADRMAHMADEMRGQLDDGVHVLCDRYVLSSLVYQGLHVDEGWVRQLNQHAAAPDLTLVIDVTVEESLRRQQVRGAQKEIYDDGDLLRRIRQRYLTLREEVGGVLIDGEDTVDVITDRLWAHVAPVVGLA